MVWTGSAPPGPARTSLPDEAGALVAVLADGMGGHAAGALASQTICNAFIESYVGGEGPAKERLQAALFGANRQLAEKVEEDSECAGMGATAVGLAMGTWGAHWISVGDSPLFLFRDGELVVLNEDHSMAPVLDEMAARGEISHAEARADGRRHFLRSAVSGTQIDLIDRSVMPLPMVYGDIFVLASDGIQTLEQNEISAVLADQASEKADVVARTLIEAVEKSNLPHQDNTTVIVIKVLEGAR